MKKKYIFVLILIFSLTFSINCFADNSNNGLASDEEKVITAIAPPQADPYISFVDGYAIGIIPDVIALLENEMNITISIINTESFKQYSEYVNSGKFDMVLDAVEDSDRNYTHIYYLTPPYLDVNYSRLSMRQTKGTSTKVAIPDEHSLSALYAGQFYYPEQIEYYGTVQDCFNAVNDGKCTEMVINSFEAEKILNDDLKNRYITTSFSAKPFELRLGVNKKLGEEFAQDVGRAIVNLDQSKISNIISLHTLYVKPEMSLLDRLYSNPTAGLMAAFTVSLTLVFVFIMTYVIKRHKNDISQKELLVAALANAENANSAKGQFLARMSHEIRTPMNAIVGLVALAKDNADDKKLVMNYLEKIDSASDILLNLLNDVLDMSAIESNKFSIVNKKFDFKEFINGVSSMFYTQCSAKNVEFNLSLTDVTEEMVIGDNLRLNQIMINLLSNAVKFTDAGGSVSFYVVQTAKTDDKVYMKFIVSDTGCGMNEDMLSRIFKPFEQESAYHTRKYGGSGLGLSIAKSLVDMMQGAISVESTKDTGTTFTVDLAFGVTNDVSAEQTKKFSSVRALVVSSDTKNCEFTLAALKSIGVEFEIADSSDKAVDALIMAHRNGIDYDICFIDCDMDGIGVKLIKRIRKHFGDDIVIVIVSAFYTIEAEEESMAAGADMFVTKPVYQPTVFNILMALSEKRKNKFCNKTTDYNFGGKRVLMAEDNQLNREIAVALLENVNLNVDCATNGQEAVDMFLKAPMGEYSLILMDVQMPIMDGYEAVKVIRASKHPDAQTIPIFAMTANAFTEDVTAALSSGMNGHIAKPIDTKTLYGTINEILKKHM